MEANAVAASTEPKEMRMTVRMAAEKAATQARFQADYKAAEEARMA